jgi:hypothetical protein
MKEAIIIIIIIIIIRISQAVRSVVENPECGLLTKYLLGGGIREY